MISKYLPNVILTVMLTAACFCSPSRAYAASAQPQASAPADDGDDGDLTYHWQNPGFSRDQRFQMGGIVVFLALVGAASALRGRNLNMRSNRL